MTEGPDVHLLSISLFPLLFALEFKHNPDKIEEPKLYGNQISVTPVG